MAVRSIRLFGDPVLRAVSLPVESLDGARALVQDLLDTVALDGRAGVAAPQIGVNLRAFSYNVDGTIGYVLNPVLEETAGDPVPTAEGCLSIPGLWHEALRHPYARVRGIDLDGAEVVLEGEGLMAQALQHETDHLDGELFLSRLPADVRRQAMREIRESDWF
jgi:peptide deformylase